MLDAPCCGQATSEALQAQRTVAKYGSVPHTSHSASFSCGTSINASATFRCRSHLRKCSCSWGGRVSAQQALIRCSAQGAHLGRRRNLGMHNMLRMLWNPQLLRRERIRPGEEKA